VSKPKKKNNKSKTTERKLTSGAKPHKLTKKDRSKGGSKRTIAKALINRKNCNDKCPMWNSCAVKYVSPQYNGKCALKQLPHKIQHRTIQAIMKGESGLNEWILELLIEASADKNIDRTKLFRMLIDGKKAIYGDNDKLQVQTEGTFTINDIITVVNKNRSKLSK